LDLGSPDIVVRQLLTERLPQSWATDREGRPVRKNGT
jgi:hypothetical protein